MRTIGVVAAQLGLMLTTATEPAFAAAMHGAPKDSGNTWNSGNFRGKGRLVNSGNFDNNNGTVNSDNTHSGANFANGPQLINERRGFVKRGR
ncbi:hypothetical protein ACFLIM_17870 [Nonomuraea sp. M3C6]|uniref:Pentapeptide repeat-containing protein n=1 Tax=Nonomuraea marmarensis TaxID=3351344 RepID=A0ABW7AFH1_9ACTN